MKPKGVKDRTKQWVLENGSCVVALPRLGNRLLNDLVCWFGRDCSSPTKSGSGAVVCHSAKEVKQNR